MARITAIKQQKRNPQRVNIYLDGSFAFPLAKIVAAWLKVGQELTPEKLTALRGQDTVEKALEMLEVDPLGLNEADRRYLLSIIHKHGGGPVGIETLASSISEDIGTVEEVIEPYLMQIGFIKRTPRGRQATSGAYGHLGIKFIEDSKQPKLI